MIGKPSHRLRLISYLARGATLLIATALLYATAASAANGPPVRELSWADEVLYQTTFIYVSATPTDVRVPAYGIGPTDPANPLDSSDPACPHDHVLSVPPGANGGEWNAHFEFNIVFPSAAGIASGRVAYSFCDLVGGLIVSAADLDGDPLTPLQPLRSEAKIQEANALGLVTIVDIGLTGIVAVRRVG